VRSLRAAAWASNTTGDAKLVLLALAEIATPASVASVTPRELEQATGLPEPTIRRILRRVRNQGHISPVANTGEVRMYAVHPQAAQ
jgi:DNA-binding IclR family transcriptional regulator